MPDGRPNCQRLRRPSRRPSGAFAIALAALLLTASAASAVPMLELVSAERSLYTSGTSFYGDGYSSSGRASSDDFGLFDRFASSVGGSAAQTSTISTSGITAAGTSLAGRAGLSEAENRVTTVFRVSETSFWRFEGEFDDGNGYSDLTLRLASEPYYGGERLWRSPWRGHPIVFEDIVRLEAGTLYTLDFTQWEDNSRASYEWSFANTPVPEPDTALLLGLGLATLARTRRD